MSATHQQAESQPVASMAPKQEQPVRAGAVDLLLDEAVASRDFQRDADALVAILRSHDYGIADLLADIARAKARLGIDGVPVLDRLLAYCIDRTAAVHETAIETMKQGFCELDGKGRILYANPALLDWLPDCEGRPLSAYFEKGGIEQTDHASEAQWVRRLDLHGSDDTRPVRIERGPVTRGKAAGFAFITDLSEDQAAQRRVHDMAEFGVLKLDPGRRVTYANEAACRMLKATPDGIIGFDSAKFVARAEGAALMEQQLELRREGVSTEYDLEINPVDGSSPINVRVRSMPETDEAGHLAGMFVTLSSIDAELAAEKVQSEIAGARDPRALFEAVVALLRPLVPFDYCSLALFTEGREFNRLLYLAPDGLETNARWVPMPEALRSLHEGPTPWGADMRQTMLEAKGGEALYNHPAAQAWLEAGQRSWFALPVQSSGMDAIFSITHHDIGRYDEKTADILEKVGVHHAMRAVLKLDQERENEFQLELIKSMAQTTSDAGLASLVVNGLASFYGWQNVSIFKVNAIKRHFVLLDQAEAACSGYRLKDSYRQPLDKGFLGKALREDRIVIVADASDKATAAEFVRVNDLTRAEMCVPIHVEGKVVWILNLEDRRPDAFTQPDRVAMERLMRALEPSLERALSAALLDRVIDDAPDGIVITDAEGTILKCNMSARDMLGRKPIGTPLVSFLDPNSPGIDAVSQLTNINIPVEVTIVGRGGNRTDVLVRTRIPKDEYDRRVILLQDKSELGWELQVRQLISTLAELTGRVRVPLSLASTFVRQIRRRVGESAPQLVEIADQAIEQLGRVDLTYDHVIEEARAGGQPAPVDLRDAVTEAMNSLPSSHRMLIRFDPEQADKLPQVLVDPQQLKASVESMLSYLLRIGEPEGHVSVRLHAFGDYAALILFKPNSEKFAAPAAAQGPAGGPVEMMIEEEARALCALDESSLFAFAIRAGGRFKRRHTLDGETLRLLLPAGEAGNV